MTLGDPPAALGSQPGAPGFAAAVAALSKKASEGQQTLQDCKTTVGTLEKEDAGKQALLRLERERRDEITVSSALQSSP